LAFDPFLWVVSFVMAALSVGSRLRALGCSKSYLKYFACQRRSYAQMAQLLIEQPKYQWLKDLGLKSENPGVFCGTWGAQGEVRLLSEIRAWVVKELNLLRWHHVRANNISQLLSGFESTVCHQVDANMNRSLGRLVRFITVASLKAKPQRAGLRSC